MRTAILSLLRDGAPPGPFPWSDLQPVLDALHAEDAAPHTLLLVGTTPERGDPLQSPHALRLLSTTAAWGWRTALVTTEAVLRTPARVAALARAGLTELSVRSPADLSRALPYDVARAAIADASAHGLAVTRALPWAPTEAALDEAIAWATACDAPLRLWPPSPAECDPEHALAELLDGLEHASKGRCPELRLNGWPPATGTHALRVPGAAPRPARSVDRAALRAGFLPPPLLGGLRHPGSLADLDARGWWALTAALPTPVAADLPPCLGGLGRVPGDHTGACEGCPLRGSCDGLPSIHRSLLGELGPAPSWLPLPHGAHVHVWIPAGPAHEGEQLRALTAALVRAGARVSAIDVHDTYDRPVPPPERLLHPRRGSDAPVRREGVTERAWIQATPGRDLTLVPASWFERARTRWPDAPLAVLDTEGANPASPPSRPLPPPPAGTHQPSLSTWANRAAQALLGGTLPAPFPRDDTPR
jgi:hypothetical protein